jgi:hypothetical protein
MVDDLGHIELAEPVGLGSMLGLVDHSVSDGPELMLNRHPLGAGLGE